MKELESVVIIIFLVVVAEAICIMILFNKVTELQQAVIETVKLIGRLH